MFGNYLNFFVIQVNQEPGKKSISISIKVAFWFPCLPKIVLKRVVELSELLNDPG